MESAAFNAIPAGISSDWWSHQYITQVNQPWVRELSLQEDEKTPFYDVCRYANVFGLEPEFVRPLKHSMETRRLTSMHAQPCCTVNHPTAYPKLLMNAFLRVSGSSGDAESPIIFHAYLIPSRLDADGIVISCESNYPFVPCALLYSVSTTKAFEFLIRVPTWASDLSTIECGQAESDTSLFSGPFEPNDAAGFHRLRIPSSGNYTIAITLSSAIRVQNHESDSISISLGPLLYAHEIDFEETTRLPRNYKDQASDCAEVADASGSEAWKSNVRDHDYLPTSQWKVAIDMSEEMKIISKDPWLDGSKRAIRELPNPVWSSGSSPVCIEVTAVEIAWPVKNGTAADPSDVDTSVRGRSFRARLVPYGTAKLHIAQFPTIKF